MCSLLTAMATNNMNAKIDGMHVGLQWQNVLNTNIDEMEGAGEGGMM